MISIEVENIGAIDLFEDNQISISIENPFFLSDRIPSPYSLDMELPASVLNLKTFGSPHFLGSKINDKHKADLLVDGIVFMRGSLIFDSYNVQSISVVYQGVIIDESVSSPQNKASWGEFKYGNVNTDPVQKEVADDLDLSTLGYMPYVAAPICDLSGIGSYEGYESIKYRNEYSPDIKSFYRDYLSFNKLGRVAPCVKLSHIMSAIMPETSALFAREPFSSIVLIPSSFLNQYEEDHGLKKFGLDDYRIVLSSCFSSNSADELLKDIAAMFCCTVYSKNNALSFSFNDDILNSSYVYDWKDKMADNIQVRREKGQEYAFSYSEIKQNNNNPAITNRVTSIRQMQNTEQTAEKMIFHINPTGEVFSRQKIDTLYQYTLIDSGMSPKQKNNSETFAVMCNLTPIPMNVKRYTIASSSSEFWNEWYVPEITYQENNDKLYIGLYHGICQAHDTKASYPLISPQQYDLNGVAHGNFSLNYNSDTGIVNFHKKYAEWISKEKIVITGKVNLRILEIASLDITTKVFYEGIYFYIKSLTIRLSNNKGLELCDTELVEC